MTAGEVWRIVPSVPALMVSSEGRVMVVPYRAGMPHGGERWYGGTPTWGVWSKEESRFIVTYKRRSYKVHRLVCEAFHGAPPFPDALVMHGNENPADNRASNLAWGTQAENLSAPGFIDYCKDRTGEHSPYARSIARRAQIEDVPQ